MEGAPKSWGELKVTLKKCGPKCSFCFNIQKSACWQCCSPWGRTQEGDKNRGWLSCRGPWEAAQPWPGPQGLWHLQAWCPFSSPEWAEGCIRGQSMQALGVVFCSLGGWQSWAFALQRWKMPSKSRNMPRFLSLWFFFFPWTFFFVTEHLILQFLFFLERKCSTIQNCHWVPAMSSRFSDLLFCYLQVFPVHSAHFWCPRAFSSLRFGEASHSGVMNALSWEAHGYDGKSVGREIQEGYSENFLEWPWTCTEWRSTT